MNEHACNCQKEGKFKTQVWMEQLFDLVFSYFKNNSLKNFIHHEVKLALLTPVASVLFIFALSLFLSLSLSSWIVEVFQLGDPIFYLISIAFFSAKFWLLFFLMTKIKIRS